MRGRSGFSLIEMLVAISVGSTLMLVAIGTLHQAMQLASMNRQRLEHGRTGARLVEQFRRDVHRAREIAVTSSTSIDMTLWDGSVLNYAAEGHRIAREQPLSAVASRRELFNFDEKSSGTFAELELPRRAVVTLQHETGLSGRAPRIDRQIAAVVGQLHTREQAGATAP